MPLSIYSGPDFTTGLTGAVVQGILALGRSQDLECFCNERMFYIVPNTKLSYEVFMNIKNITFF